MVMRFDIKFGMKSGQDFKVMINIQTGCYAVGDGDMKNGYELRMLPLISAKDHQEDGFS